MALLKYRDYDKYVLKFFYEVNKPMHRKDTYNKLKEYTNTSDEDFNMITKNGYNKFNSRIHWSLVVLKKAQLIENVDKGVYQITDFGKKFYEENPNFDFKTLKEKTPYLENSKNNSDIDDIEETEDENRNEIEKSIEEYPGSTDTKQFTARTKFWDETNASRIDQQSGKSENQIQRKNLRIYPITLPGTVFHCRNLTNSQQAYAHRCKQQEIIHSVLHKRDQSYPLHSQYAGDIRESHESHQIGGNGQEAFIGKVFLDGRLGHPFKYYLIISIIQSEETLFYPTVA